MAPHGCGPAFAQKLRRGRSGTAGALPSRRTGRVGRVVRSPLRGGRALHFPAGPDFTREDAEEICQEVFLSVIKNLGSFHGESRFQTWLFRIAANQARDYREKRNAAKRGGGQTTVSLQAEDPETGLAPDPPANAPGPDDLAMNAEQMAGVRAALDRVGEPCREIIELRYFGDLSYEELSSTLNLNPKTVSSRLSKCLDRLEEIARGIFARENRGVFPSN